MCDSTSVFLAPIRVMPHVPAPGAVRPTPKELVATIERTLGMLSSFRRPTTDYDIAEEEGTRG